MTEGVWLWVAFALMAMTTVGTRGSFILLGEKGRLPPALQRALRYAPAAALSALVMPDLLLDGGEFTPPLVDLLHVDDVVDVHELQQVEQECSILWENSMVKNL